MSTLLPAVYGLALVPHAVFFGIAVYLFIAPFYDKLSGRAFIEFFQRADPYMKAWAPRLALAQLALTLLLLGLLHDRWAGLSFWLTASSFLTGVAAMIIAIRGNVPLNRQMDHWSPAEPPGDWEKVRDRWLRFHSLRGAAEIAGFVLLLSAALIDGPSLGGGPSPTGAPAESPAGGPAPRRYEATIYLPLADNQGRPFAEADWHEALERLVAPFGGATLGLPQEGCWVDAGGRVCREPIRPVVVSFVPERLGEFRKTVLAVGQRLGQEAMYVRFEEPCVDLIPVAAHSGEEP